MSVKHPITFKELRELLDENYSPDDYDCDADVWIETNMAGHFRQAKGVKFERDEDGEFSVYIYYSKEFEENN